MDNSETLLSARRNARTCSSLKSTTRTHGTVLSPSFLAALARVCPATITPALSITIGTLNPNSRMLSVTASTEASLFRGFFSYGLIDLSGNSSICMLPPSQIKQHWIDLRFKAQKKERPWRTAPFSVRRRLRALRKQGKPPAGIEPASHSGSGKEGDPRAALRLFPRCHLFTFKYYQYKAYTQAF